ncbi:hypothetical protein PI125_g24485 [Phytophthora idaei]|nr:hypothetical protein PI125_g24485 [Phytophthora idaei]
MIMASEVFDGKMQTFERSDITCSGGGRQKDTVVFLVEAGGTLTNDIMRKPDGGRALRPPYREFLMERRV